MNTLKERIFTNWHLIRIFRLGIGIMMLVAGFQSRDWMLGLLSAFFLYQAITDTGCCGTKACYTPPGKGRVNIKRKDDDTVTEYEEIK